MAGPAFKELVTRLRDTYLAKAPKDPRRYSRPAQATLPPDELQQDVDREEAELARQLESLPLGIVDHIWIFLHPDGRSLWFSLYYDEVTAEHSDERTLDYSLRVGSRRFPELLSLMSPRPPEAGDCVVCAGTGWRSNGEDEFSCPCCFGRGWLPRGLSELVDRTAGSLRRAGDDREAIVAVVHPYLDDGLALGLDATVLSAAFDGAVRLAGFVSDERVRRSRICATIGNERFPDGWPYWTEESDAE